MAIIFDKYNINLEIIMNRNLPIISCVPYNEIHNINIDEFTTVNLGIELSKMIFLGKKDDSNNIQDVLNNLLEEFDKVIVNNIDIIFNPSYKLNVLKFFINLARTKLIIVHWPGEIKGNVLQYSQINFTDYVKYDLNDYDIACIK